MSRTSPSPERCVQVYSTELRFCHTFKILSFSTTELRLSQTSLITSLLLTNKTILMSNYSKVIEGFKDQSDKTLEEIIVDYKGRVKLGNVYAFMELKRRGKPINQLCQSKLDEFAINQGFKNWDAYFENFQSSNSDVISSKSEVLAQRTVLIGERYPTLIIISGALAFVAWAVGILALIIAIVLFTNLHSDGAWVLPVGIFIIGVIFFILLLACSESIKVFIDIEQNTRKAAAK